MANPVPLEPGVDIRSVDPVWDLPFLQIVEDIFFPHIENRPARSRPPSRAESPSILRSRPPRRRASGSSRPGRPPCGPARSPTPPLFRKDPSEIGTGSPEPSPRIRPGTFHGFPMRAWNPLRYPSIQHKNISFYIDIFHQFFQPISDLLPNRSRGSRNSRARRRPGSPSRGQVCRAAGTPNPVPRKRRRRQPADSVAFPSGVMTGMERSPFRALTVSPRR